MKKLLLSIIFLLSMPFIYGQYNIRVLTDTTELKLYDGSGLCLLEKFGGGDRTGGGIFIRQDSAYTEGTHAFDYSYPGYQWVRLPYIGGELSDFNALTAVTIVTTGLITANSLTVSGGLTNIGSGTFTTANGDNDLGVDGDLEVNGITDLDGFLSVTTTSSSTSGGTSIRPIYMQHTMTGIGGVGGRAEFSMTTNVALGSWSNALKGIVTYGTAGKTTGLGSAIVGELSFGVGNTSGTYAPIESELVANTTAPVSSTSTSFFYGNIAGSDATGKTNLNTYGYLFELGAGVVETNNGMLDAESITDADFTHVIKIKTSVGILYLGANTSKSF